MIYFFLWIALIERIHFVLALMFETLQPKNDKPNVALTSEWFSPQKDMVMEK